MADTEHCGNCKFFDVSLFADDDRQVSSYIGSCRRYPPQLLAIVALTQEEDHKEIDHIETSYNPKSQSDHVPCYGTEEGSPSAALNPWMWAHTVVDTADWCGEWKPRTP